MSGRSVATRFPDRMNRSVSDQLAKASMASPKMGALSESRRNAAPRDYDDICVRNGL